MSFEFLARSGEPEGLFMLTKTHGIRRAKHWTPMPVSNKEYPWFVKELVTAILRSWSVTLMRDSDGFIFVMSQEQESSLRALEGALRNRDTDRALAVSCCQSFLWEVVSAKDKGGWTDVTQQWVWLRALRADGNFYGASSLTPDLAKIKYLIRQMALLQAFVEPLGSEGELIE